LPINLIQRPAGSVDSVAHLPRREHDAKRQLLPPTDRPVLTPAGEIAPGIIISEYHPHDLQPKRMPDYRVCGFMCGDVEETGHQPRTG
jgi:hypothetical protein